MCKTCLGCPTLELTQTQLSCQLCSVKRDADWWVSNENVMCNEALDTRAAMSVSAWTTCPCGGRETPVSDRDMQNQSLFKAFLGVLILESTVGNSGRSIQILY